MLDVQFVVENSSFGPIYTNKKSKTVILGAQHDNFACFNIFLRMGCCEKKRKLHEGLIEKSERVWFWIRLHDAEGGV